MNKFLLGVATTLAISVSALTVVPLVLPEHTETTVNPPPPVIPKDGTTPYVEGPTTFTIPLDSVIRIACPTDKPHYVFRGTAEVINGNTLFTASHVVNQKKECTLDDGSDLPAHVIYDRYDMDYATLYADTQKKGRIPIDCGGFVPGHVYMMVGYANGTDFVVQTAVATAQFSDSHDWETDRPFTHVRTLIGVVNRSTAIGGMSGGPIFDLHGNMVGTTLASPRDDSSPIVFAREMKDTYICQPNTTPPNQ